LPVSVHPNSRRLHYLAPLSAGHGFEGAAEGRSPPRFHLDERNERTAPRDEVDLDAADPKPMRHDIPAPHLEIPDCLLFTGKAAPVTGIRPGIWITVNAV
jgi:hypothetical protein